ncbi:uncharacterized protein LOC124807685 [Hydra vulgaris]|uniref:uncharacterized protein LOC124807685 n=1 Tax=Hydra vulgaris TaxID=6087 RepID=UPI0032EA74B8
MTSRNDRRKRENEMDTFISRLKGETDSYLTQFKTVAENENVTIGEDYFNENVSSIFDEATGCDNEGDEDENNKSEVPSEENHESNNFSSLHTKWRYSTFSPPLFL